MLTCTVRRTVSGWQVCLPAGAAEEDLSPQGTARLGKSLSPGQRLPAGTSRQTVAEETERWQSPAAGGCSAEEGQSRDPPALSLNTFHEGEAIAAAKSVGPMLHKHHGADGPCLKASLPD